MKTAADKINLSFDLRVLQRTVLHFKTIDSTNRFLLDAEDFLNGTVVLADDQTAGRGRFNRVWQSLPETALLFSILLNNLSGRKMPAVYTFLAAVGVYQGLWKSLPAGINLSLKWPNDVLLNGKKVCGILVQGKITAGRYEKLVVGIGLNVNQQRQFFVNDLEHATSLAAESGFEWDRIGILNKVLTAIDHLLIVLQESGERPIIRMWQDACGSIGREIAINDGKEIYRGVFDSLSEDGGLRLRTKSGQKLFYAGDVTVLKE
ncbi:biotin--[acetyl-CoA-carboxylase] ligase [bacterium]|nr:biotin--[acetyl-CoA-carboxylase] ligase [bacterium]MBU1065604.1 biotin--[acetyl-CoA-carboxylase] ligase [bacterium]MBU1634019.1 biotin--[acetyl-CoA-carboxylase] ligase [bacterium]MBU1873446.1 biotin--[acetyl-CoA-carboxylase] ligase [bacterium]